MKKLVMGARQQNFSKMSTPLVSLIVMVVVVIVLDILALLSTIVILFSGQLLVIR